MEVEQTLTTTAASLVPSREPLEQSSQHSHGSETVQSDSIGIRGGGCICDRVSLPATPSQNELPTLDPVLQAAELPEESNAAQKTTRPRHTSWPGWAELENDPEIFTILLQEWGMRNVQVTEVYDITELLELNPSSVYGLIFLSRYVPSDQDIEDKEAYKADEGIQQPWFTNQISKFSCGTVALMNILMNIQSTDIDLSETLSNFRSSTNEMNAKHKGIALDNHSHFRDIHNSFSTKLDQYIVDVMLKDEVNKAKQRAKAQTANKKRKRGVGTGTKRRKRKETLEDDEEESGFHFVAYVSAHGNVWKMDGMQAAPKHVAKIEEGQTWLNVTVQDVLPLLQEALNADQQCTMMSVTRSEGASMMSSADKARKQQDWAPFIETLIRIHAERGDLNDMLGL